MPCARDRIDPGRYKTGGKENCKGGEVIRCMNAMSHLSSPRLLVLL